MRETAQPMGRRPLPFTARPWIPTGVTTQWSWTSRSRREWADRRHSKNCFGSIPQVLGIVTSGFPSDPVMAEFKAHGFSAALAKPFRLQELTDTLEGLLKHET